MKNHLSGEQIEKSIIKIDLRHEKQLNFIKMKKFFSFSERRYNFHIFISLLPRYFFLNIFHRVCAEMFLRLQKKVDRIV